MNFCEKCDTKLDLTDVELNKKIFGTEQKICKNCLAEEIEPKIKNCYAEIAHHNEILRILSKNNIGKYILFFVMSQLGMLYLVIGGILCNTGQIINYNNGGNPPFLLHEILEARWLYDWAILGILIDLAISGGGITLAVFGALALLEGKFLEDSSRVVGHHYEVIVSGNTIKTQKVNEYEGGGEWFVNFLMVLVVMCGIACAGILICIIKQVLDNSRRKTVIPQCLASKAEATEFLQKVRSTLFVHPKVYDFLSLIREYTDKCRRRDFDKEEVKKVSISLPSIIFQGKKIFLVDVHGDSYIFCCKGDYGKLGFYVGNELKSSDKIYFIAENITRTELDTAHFNGWYADRHEGNLLTDDRYDLQAIIEMQQ